MTSFDASQTTLTSAASLRVLAHPTRLQLLALLREHGAQTAAQLGEVVDEAPGTISYHLNKLASIALIEPAEGMGQDRRERWWRATTALTNWESADLLDDPEALAASSALEKAIAQIHAARYGQYLDTIPVLPREWVAAGANSDRRLRLTPDELSTMRAELDALAARWSETSAAHDAAGDDGSAPVALVYQAYRNDSL